MLIQFGIIKTVSNNSQHSVTLPTAYKTFYIGVTDMGGNLNNGCVTRFNEKTLTYFYMGVDVPAAVYVSYNKYWITIGF